MSKAKPKRLNEQAGPEYRARTKDFYIEPAWTADALFACEKFIEGTIIWDPCCGTGTIPLAARRAGYLTWASDLEVKYFPEAECVDFLGQPSHLKKTHRPIVICMNPPYGGGQKAIDFITRALATPQVHKVCVLVGQNLKRSRDRYPWFEEHPPAMVWSLSDRPSMPPGEQFLAGEIKASGGFNDFDWLVWDRTYNGPERHGRMLNPRERLVIVDGKGKKETKAQAAAREDGQHREPENPPGGRPRDWRECVRSSRAPFQDWMS